MDKYPFISQSGRKEVDRNTQRQIRTYAMVNHLKQKAEAKSAHATASHFAPIHAGHQPLKSRRENTTSTLKNTRPCSEKTRDRFVTTEGYIVANKRQQASTNNDSKMSLGDVAVYCGSYPFEGIPHELSRQVSFALMFRRLATLLFKAVLTDRTRFQQSCFGPPIVEARSSPSVLALLDEQVFQQQSDFLRHDSQSTPIQCFRGTV